MFNRLRMLAANAAPHLEEGETVRATVIGRINTKGGDLADLIPDISTLDMATNSVPGDEFLGSDFSGPADPNYAVMATERNLYVFRLRHRSFAKFDELVAKHEIGSVQVLLGSVSGSLLIGTLYMGTGLQRGRARRVIEAVGGRVVDDQTFNKEFSSIWKAQQAEATGEEQRAQSQ